MVTIEDQDEADAGGCQGMSGIVLMLGQGEVKMKRRKGKVGTSDAKSGQAFSAGEIFIPQPRKSRRARERVGLYVELDSGMPGLTDEFRRWCHDELHYDMSAYLRFLITYAMAHNIRPPRE